MYTDTHFSFTHLWHWSVVWMQYNTHSSVIYLYISTVVIIYSPQYSEWTYNSGIWLISSYFVHSERVIHLSGGFRLHKLSVDLIGHADHLWFICHLFIFLTCQPEQNIFLTVFRLQEVLESHLSRCSKTPLLQLIITVNIHSTLILIFILSLLMGIYIWV